MIYLDIINKASELLNLPVEIVDKTYKAYWFYIKQTILSLPLRDNMNLDLNEFSKLHTNFNIPSIGKLACTYDRILNLKKRYKILKSLKKEKS